MRLELFPTLVVALAAAFGLTIACGGSGTGTPTVTLVPATLPADRTGIPEVDAVVEAVLSHNVGAFRALMRFTAGPCTTALQSEGGQPPCQPGETEGTTVEFVPGTVAVGQLSRCEASYYRRDEIDGMLEASALSDASLFAVYRTPGSEPPRQYTAVFSFGFRDKV